MSAYAALEPHSLKSVANTPHTSGFHAVATISNTIPPQRDDGFAANQDGAYMLAHASRSFGTVLDEVRKFDVCGQIGPFMPFLGSADSEATPVALTVPSNMEPKFRLAGVGLEGDRFS